MRARSVGRMVRLPIRLHGIQLGRAVDVLLDQNEWRVLGFEVLCGDEAPRFLPFSTAHVDDEEIVVRSALMLLEDVDFYRSRARSLRALVGTTVDELGELHDLCVADDGTVLQVVVLVNGDERRVPPPTAQQDAA
jgi:hypothetical protein